MIHLSQDGARAMLLAAQGLLSPPEQPAGKEDVLAAIRRMGALQIDTIHVVARSPYLVLWSRVGAYEPRWLEELLAEGALFEYWSHAACFIPVEDYGLYRHRMLQAVPYTESWGARHSGVLERIVDRIREGGAVRAAEFERLDGKAGVWWDRKPEKIALEALYNTGQLMIARRERFQRVYDLRERVLPTWDDAMTPSPEETQRALALKAVRALGVAPARWVPDYFRVPKKGIARLLEELADEGSLLRVTIEHGKDLSAYAHPDDRELLEQAAAGLLRPSKTTLLSPFDPIVWDRARARELFGFDYRIEVYTPSECRKYGYFTLPILHRGALVGRLDPKAHRKEALFEVRALHLEPGVSVTDELVSALAETLRDCAAWHQTPRVVVRQTHPSPLVGALQPLLDDEAS